VKIRSVECLRGLAALSVAVAHADAAIGNSPYFTFGRWHSFAMPGTVGVEFFFVLSGFVMALVHGREIGPGGHVGRFLWKRVCRIYPVFWVVLTLPIIRFWGAPSITVQNVAEWASLLPIRTDNLVVVAWTLRQEVTFYLMLALCLLPRIGRAVLGAWIAATVAWWYLLPRLGVTPALGLATVPVNHVLSLFNMEFFAGLLAGWLLPRWTRRRGTGWPLLLGGLAVLAWRMAQDGWGAEYGPVTARPVYGLAYGLVILGAAMLERDGALRFGRRGARAAAWAGALSYPLYLVHLFAFDWVARPLGESGAAARIGPDATFALLLLAGLAAATVLTVGVDQPLQRLLRRVSAGSRRSAPAPG
jgi:exopolysaccharide production protein ExoZ